MRVNNTNHRGAQTFHHAQQTGAELQRSAEYARRTLWSAAHTVRAAMLDGAYAMLGAGDYTAAMVREARDASKFLPRRLLQMARATPARLNGGFEELTLRGQHVAARIRRDRDVQAAVRRTVAAGREAREAVTTARDAATAQARGARKAGHRFGRSGRQRYEAMTLEELTALAAQRDIEGRSSMNKRELIRALRR